MTNTSYTPGPPPNEPKKNWFARHKFLTALLVIIGIGILGSALGGGNDSDDAVAPATSTTPAEETTEVADGSDGESSAEAPDAEEPAEEPTEEPAATMGTPVEVGDFTITINSFDTGLTTVGSEYFGADAQGQFVVVDASIMNNGKKAETFWTDSMTLIDEQDREHSYSSDGSIYLDGAWLLDEINPGNTLQGKFVFDIPADATPTAVKVEDGIFGTPVTIALN